MTLPLHAQAVAPECVPFPDWPCFSEGRVPARSAVAVSDLAIRAKVEIECTAVRSRP